MTALTDQPKNINPFADVQFKFDVAALPNTSFFIQTVNLPGVTLEAAMVATPQLSFKLNRQQNTLLLFMKTV